MNLHDIWYKLKELSQSGTVVILKVEILLEVLFEIKCHMRLVNCISLWIVHVSSKRVNQQVQFEAKA